MATVIGYQPLDMSGNDPGGGVVTVDTPTLISVDDGFDRIDYVGIGFAFDDEGNLISGTLTGINSYTSAGTVQVYALTGLNHSIVTFNNYLLANDLQGAQAFLFSGSDTFVGSNGNDVAIGYGGNDSMDGMGGNDRIYGYDGNDTISGGDGHDTVDGGVGADSLMGGVGDDVYWIDASDTVVEGADAGIDTIIAGFTYTLAANFENLTLSGAAVINGTGNGLDNVITGNDASNALYGGAGADTLFGGGGFLSEDTLDGGTGNDLLHGGDGNDTYIVDSSGDVIFDVGGVDTVLASATYSLVGTNTDILILTGNAVINGTGNEYGNTLNGNDAANVLDGGLGVDTMAGDAGDDSYIVDNFSDVVIEGLDAGVDSVFTSVTFTLPANVENLTLTGDADGSLGGNALDNKLTGNASANGLNGGAGADTLIGGDGNDTYYFVESADVIVENDGEGTDQIWVLSSFSLAGYAYVENLWGDQSTAKSLIGNDLDNWLVSFDGDDYFDGGLGEDSMSGNGGNDTYIIDSFGDVIYEYVGTGIDTVRTGLNGYTLGADIDVLVLTGSGGLSGSGNALNNILSGNNGDDTLDGGSGSDIIAGGPGNDTYIVDHSGDQVMELPNSGIDTVQSSVSYNLMQAWHVENLNLTGSSNINGTGNWLNNVIEGNSGNNLIAGGPGNDTLIGGDGDDILVYDAADGSVQGGAGTDTLRVDGSGVTLDLTAISDTLIQDVEIIDITGSGSNTLTLALADVLAISSTTNDLMIRGNPGDVVNADNGWVANELPISDGTGSDANHYNVYTQGLATLLVDTDILVHINGS